MIGSPMDSAGFAGLASALAGNYTVVTYDPRGIGNSSREGARQDVTLEQQADDVHRLLSVLGGEPAYVFGSSGGAAVGLALVTAHPRQVRTLVAHEPPVVELLPHRAQLRAEIQDIYDSWRADGADKAMAKFMAHAGLSGGPGTGPDAPRWEPSPEQIARTRATAEVFLAHLIRPTTRYRGRTSPRCGRHRRASSRRRGHLQRTAGQPQRRGTGRPARHAVVEFPGEHGGFMAVPEQFGRVLHQVLTPPT